MIHKTPTTVFVDGFEVNGSFLNKINKIKTFTNSVTLKSFFIWKITKENNRIPTGTKQVIAYDFYGMSNISKNDLSDPLKRDAYRSTNTLKKEVYINNIIKEIIISPEIDRSFHHVILNNKYYNKSILFDPTLFSIDNYMIGLNFEKDSNNIEYAFFSIEKGEDGYDIIESFISNSNKFPKINNPKNDTYGSADGLVPVPNYPIVNDLKIETKFPEKYQLKKYDIKNQNPFGTCWAFAACECLNYELLKIKNELEKDIISNDNFSQLHMVLFNPYSVTLNSGGSYWHVMNYLSQWVGPVFKKYTDDLSDYELAIKLYKDFIKEYISQEEAFEILKTIAEKQIIFNPNKDYKKDLLNYIKFDCLNHEENNEKLFSNNIENYVNCREVNRDRFKDISKDIKKEIERRYWNEIRKYLLENIKFDHSVHYICPNASILTNDKDKGLKDFEITNIKQALNNNKAVAISFNIKSYEENFNELYSSKETDTNHVVTIIGYNDNYRKENFKNIFDETPKDNGAFLVKNSWGYGAHDNGCFWLSYYDKNICHAVIYDLEEIPKETEIISYNKGVALNKREGKIGKTIFTMKNDGRIEAVRSYFFVGGTYITVKILVNNIVKKVFLEFIDYPGYKTFKLSNYSTLIETIKTISCKAGDKVEIEIDYNYLNRKDSDIVPVEIEAYRLKPETKIGTCFVDGKDISSFGENLGISLLYYSK